MKVRHKKAAGGTKPAASCDVCYKVLSATLSEGENCFYVPVCEEGCPERKGKME